MTTLNPHAHQYFQDNPEARYWYYSANIRIPNPKVRKDPHYKPDPWPDHGNIANP